MSKTRVKLENVLPNKDWTRVLLTKWMIRNSLSKSNQACKHLQNWVLLRHNELVLHWVPFGYCLSFIPSYADTEAPSNTSHEDPHSQLSFIPIEFILVTPENINRACVQSAWLAQLLENRQRVWLCAPACCILCCLGAWVSLHMQILGKGAEILQPDGRMTFTCP